MDVQPMYSREWGTAPLMLVPPEASAALAPGAEQGAGNIVMVRMRLPAPEHPVHM